MVCVFRVSAGSATTFRRVRSMPMPASDSTAAMFTFCGKCGTPSRAGPSNRVVAARQPVEVDAELLPHRGFPSRPRAAWRPGSRPRRRRPGRRSSAHRGRRCRPRARRTARRCAAAAARRGSRRPSSASAPAESTTTLIPALEQRDEVLAHRVVRGRLDHRRGPRGQQRLAPDHVRNAELARQLRAARAARRARRARQISTPGSPRGMLQHEARDGAAAQQCDAHGRLLGVSFA